MGIISLLAMPETPVYLKRRIAALENPAEVPAAGKKTPEQSQGGVVDALKFIFAHKQMRSIALCAFIFVASTGGTNYYESIMKTGGMATAQVTRAMYFIPFCNALMTAIGGFITDALGRKKSAILLSAVAFAGLITFVISSGTGMAPAIVGISYEFNRWCGRCDNALTRVLTAPGLWMQNFTTFEPDDSMIEVGIRALELVLPDKQGEDQW